MSVCYYLVLKFKMSKSVYVCFDRSYIEHVPEMYLRKEVIQWASRIMYLEISFLSGKRMTFNVDTVKREFYMASNCLFSNAGNLDALLQLKLQCIHCLPLLQ